MAHILQTCKTCIDKFEFFWRKTTKLVYHRVVSSRNAVMYWGLRWNALEGTLFNQLLIILSRLATRNNLWNIFQNLLQRDHCIYILNCVQLSIWAKNIQLVSSWIRDLRFWCFTWDFFRIRYIKKKASKLSN